MKYPLIKDDWRTEKIELASNDKGIRLSALFRYDGNGNTISRFEIMNIGRTTTYEKHDTAATAYQIEVDKAKARKIAA